jgi:hypothetical protein
MDHPEQPSPNSPPPPPAPSPAAKKAEAEQLAQRLRAEVRKRRPRLLAWLAVAVALFAGLAGLVLWRTWPRPEPPRLAVIAFDQLYGPATARRELLAQLVPVEVGAEPPRLDGFEVFFQERIPTQLPNAAARSIRGVSDADGRVAAPQETSVLQGVLTVITRHALTRPRHSTEDTARVYVRPQGTSVLAVDLASLTVDADPKWGGVPADRIKIREGAAGALAKAAKGQQVVYLALVLERPEEYRAVRGWVHYQASAVRPGLPDGPVLCRFVYGAKASAAEARERFFKEVEALCPERKERTFVTATATRAEEYAKVGRTYLLGADTPPPPGITRLASWAEFP